LQQRFPALKATVYWHDDNGGFQVRLDQPIALGERTAEAYRRMAADPYFNATSPGLAP